VRETLSPKAKRGREKTRACWQKIFSEQYEPWSKEC